MYYIDNEMEDKLRKTSGLVAELINTTQEIPIGVLKKHIGVYEDKIYELEQKKVKLTLARDILKVIYKQKRDKFDREASKIADEKL